MRLEADRFAHNQWPDAEFRKEIGRWSRKSAACAPKTSRVPCCGAAGRGSLRCFTLPTPVVGWMSDLDAMAPDDVRQFHHRWYVPGNATVVVAGDVDVAKVRALAEKYYGSIPARAVPERKPASSRPTRPAPHRGEARRTGLWRWRFGCRAWPRPMP